MRRVAISSLMLTGSFGVSRVHNSDITDQLSVHRIDTFSNARRLGGAGTFWESLGEGGSGVGYSVDATDDGGVILTGYTPFGVGGGDDILVAKLDAEGNVTWATAIGSSGDDEGHSIIETDGGDGYVLTGGLYGYNYNYNAVVAKVNHTGGLVWARSFYGEAGSDHRSYGNEIIESDDGNFVFAGYVSDDSTTSAVSLIVKLNHTGGVVWQSTGRTSGVNYAQALTQTPDGDYIVIGDRAIVIGESEIDKFNAQGEKLLRDSNFGLMLENPLCLTSTGVHNSVHFLQERAIQTTLDGGFVLTGYARFYRNSTNCENTVVGTLFIMKIQPDGNFSWGTLFKVDVSYRDYARGYAIQEVSDGGFIVTGQTTGRTGTEVYYESDAGGHFMMARFSEKGEPVWAKKFEGVNGLSVTETSDGGFVATGYEGHNYVGLPEGKNVLVVKVDHSGEGVMYPPADDIQWVSYTIVPSGGEACMAWSGIDDYNSQENPTVLSTFLTSLSVSSVAMAAVVPTSPATDAPQTTTAPNESKGVTIGASVAAGVVLLGAVGGGVYAFLRKKRSKSRSVSTHIRGVTAALPARSMMTQGEGVTQLHENPPMAKALIGNAQTLGVTL